jgi:hypothetical protein
LQHQPSTSNFRFFYSLPRCIRYLCFVHSHSLPTCTH